jgi:hypothetical protein
LLVVLGAGRVVAVLIGHDMETVLPDQDMIGTAPDEDGSIGAELVWAIGHIFEGVVGEGQVGNGLVERLPPSPPLL